MLSFKEKEASLGRVGGPARWLARAPTAKGSAGWSVGRLLRASFCFCVVHIVTQVKSFPYTRDSKEEHRYPSTSGRMSRSVRGCEASSALHLVLEALGLGSPTRRLVPAFLGRAPSPQDKP